MSSSDSSPLSKILFLALAVSIAVAVMVYGCTYVNWDSPRSPDDLADIALSSSDPDEQQQAAAELADLGSEATSQLRRVLTESTTPAVKALAIDGLGKIPDYESMDEILAALDDESVIVRGRAAKHVRAMLGRSFPYDANAPQKEREQMNAAMRKEWEAVKGTELFRQFQQRQQRAADRPATINIRNRQSTP